MKFSVITCTYNSESYLQENIDSVKKQNFQDFEHIFIDAFSSDRTMRIIRQYKDINPDKVRVYQYTAKGIANAMNHGIKHSSGDYLIHLHSDDCFYDNRVLGDVNKFIISKKNPDWIYGLANFINKDAKKSKVIPHRDIYKKVRFWLLLLTNYIPHQSVFIKKSIFEKLGYFDESLKNSMDYDMWLKIAKKTDSFFMDRIICNFSMRGDSQSIKNKNNDEHYLSQKKYLKNKLLLIFLRFINKLDKKRNFF